METLNATSLNIDLDCVRDEIKLLRLRIQAMAVHKDTLTKQLNEAMEFEQQLTEKLNRYIDKEIRLIGEKEDLMKRLNYEPLDDVSYLKLESEEAENVCLAGEVKSMGGTHRSTDCMISFRHHKQLLDHNQTMHSADNSAEHDVSDLSKLNDDVSDFLPADADVGIDFVQELQASFPTCNCPVCQKPYSNKLSLLKHIKIKSCIRKDSSRFAKLPVRVRKKSNYVLQQLTPSCLVRNESVLILLAPDVPTLDSPMCYVCHSYITTTTDISDSSLRDNEKDICTTCEGIYPDLARRAESDTDDTIKRQFGCSKCTRRYSD